MKGGLKQEVKEVVLKKMEVGGKEGEGAMAIVMDSILYHTVNT